MTRDRSAGMSETILTSRKLWQLERQLEEHANASGDLKQTRAAKKQLKMDAMTQLGGG